MTRATFALSLMYIIGGGATFHLCTRAFFAKLLSNALPFAWSTLSWLQEPTDRMALKVCLPMMKVSL